ncbi:DEAD/DEAH box helicase [Microbacterium sp. KSW4-17]|uniref:DEAD/DEAH box helicase n=1 Tax=Microbacterium galbum TaxID=3075994 RepID=A0ABU3T674_9MICO|nr:DEAD/DEAH box helicase [Microbacterium sp. KSW4-17]MDU0366879.1 DEAD/DEAH box helicase [Microbacterium sp. KSW4-17]
MTDAMRGTVSRRGGDLVISAPAGAPAVPTGALEQELVIFAGAERTSDGDFELSVDRAAEASDVLARPWPSGLWEWDWTPAATRAVAVARGVKEAVDRVLADDPPSATASMTEDLSAAGFERTLLPSQSDAVARLAIAGGGGNFSVPGSGKTTMTYAVFALLRLAGVVDRMLVIAPQSAYEAWTTEAADCFESGREPSVAVAPTRVERDADVLVLNYERAASGANRAVIDTWGQGHRFLVVFDEAHRAKRGQEGLHGRGALDVSRMAAARLVLTGTPMPNSSEDLITILDLAWPGQGRRLASPLTIHADRAWVRVTKDELELEPATVRLEPVELDPAHRRIYDALVTDTLAMNDLENHADLANRAIMRMIGAVSNPALLLPRSQDSALTWPEELPDPADLRSLLANIASSTTPTKLLAAARHADAHAAAGTKLLIWTNFIGNVDELTRLLAPYNPSVVTGRTPRSDPAAVTDRDRELRRFREDGTCSVLIATPQTLGEGVSLHKVCQSQLHIDRTFNAGLYLQTLDRTHRVGMPAGTTADVTVLVARNTIDERIDRSIRGKLKGMGAVLADPTLSRLARVDPEAAGDPPDPGTLRRLLRHMREHS